MIRLIDVGKYYPTQFGKHWIFRHVDLTLDLDRSVAVIGPNGAGKSTFLRILAGADIPSEGRVIRRGHISPPMGLTPTLQANLSASENARFAGRIYGLTRDEIEGFIEDVRLTADIGKYFDMPVSTYSAGMRQRVAFSINISLDFDFYLFDEISAGGDREFRKFSKAKVQERLKKSKFIIASHRYDDLLDLCDAAIVIQNGELRYFEDIREALAIYEVESDAEDEGPKAPRRARQRARRDLPRTGRDEAIAIDEHPDQQIAPDAPKQAGRAALRERRLARLRVLSQDDAVAAPEKASTSPSDEDRPTLRRDELRARLRAMRRERHQTREGGSGRDSVAEEAVPASLAAPSGGPVEASGPAAICEGPAHPPAKPHQRVAGGSRRAPEGPDIAPLRKSDGAGRIATSTTKAAPDPTVTGQDGDDSVLSTGAGREPPHEPPAKEQPRPRDRLHAATRLKRAAYHQDRARVKSDRARRLLLQHLELPKHGEDGDVSLRRQALIAAAQEIAAANAATARKLLDVPTDEGARISTTRPGPGARLLARRARHDLSIAHTDPD